MAAHKFTIENVVMGLAQYAQDLDVTSNSIVLLTRLAVSAGESYSATFQNDFVVSVTHVSIVIFVIFCLGSAT